MAWLIALGLCLGSLKAIALFCAFMESGGPLTEDERLWDDEMAE